MPASQRQVSFARRPIGTPTEDCFTLATVPVGRPGPGQVLVRNDVLSVDPYIRMRMEEKDSYAPVMRIGDVLVGRTVGQVVESHADGFVEGQWVVGRLGWQDYSVASPAELQLVDVSAAPATAYLGALGSTGITAWVGLHAFGKPKAGETVLVSAASGAVGSVVGQLARLHGCRAVGIAGGAAKCELVRSAYGFDDCIDYRAPDFAEALRRALPQGVDVYFDNVGGPILDAVLPLCNNFARIPLCGLVSQYNATEPYGMKNLREVFNRRVTIRGFVLSDHKDLWPQASAALAGAYAAGRLQYRETITEGLENAPRAFIDMLAGANVGKQLVRLRPAA
ncbi:zinc-binding dehydrogenase [Xylophilus rhododendri]|uniref:Zinc-binding dehydrogenase n=1 Tax=Xylophilus rhododendri TaxID=2697032 RepID=A0A857JFH8_9BURK|nr:zinc-binding dehydrogenase [Xylophilus rhododendri]